MPRKIRQLRADLLASGAYVASKTGSHEKWKHPNVGGSVTLAYHKEGQDADHYQERDVKVFIRRIQHDRN
jgi:predicted RNA binding protein YcfA (HicA-like mRNA interferase family)